MKFKWIQIFIILCPLTLLADTPYYNVMIYEGGDVQVNSEVYTYENIVAGVPIKGSVLITHDTNEVIDVNSFSLDGKPLKVEFTQTVTASPSNKLVLSIYRFQIAGLAAGSQTLAPIKVKVAGKEYAAPPLSFDVAPKAS
jgi:hypothetical protein